MSAFPESHFSCELSEDVLQEAEYARYLWNRILVVFTEKPPGAADVGLEGVLFQNERKRRVKQITCSSCRDVRWLFEEADERREISIDSPGVGHLVPKDKLAEHAF